LTSLVEVSEKSMELTRETQKNKKGDKSKIDNYGPKADEKEQPK